MMDTIYRQDAIDALNVGAELLKRALNDADIVGAERATYEWELELIEACISDMKELPPAQPFHNITMNDVLKYIDAMPEDVWQEFTACLECRGWELKRRTAKWCGSEFA